MTSVFFCFVFCFFTLQHHVIGISKISSTCYFFGIRNLSLVLYIISSDMFGPFMPAFVWCIELFASVIMVRSEALTTVSA